MKHFSHNSYENQTSGIQAEPLGVADKLFHAIGTPVLRAFVSVENRWNSLAGRETPSGAVDSLSEQQARINCGRLATFAIAVVASRGLIVDPHSV